MEIKLGLASVPNKPNKLGYTYTKDTYNIMMDNYEKHFAYRDRFYSNAVCIHNCSKDIYKIRELTPEQVLGYVTNIDLETETATIDINISKLYLKKRVEKYYPDLLEHPEKYKLGMRMIGTKNEEEKIYDDMRLICFDIIRLSK